MTVPLKDAQAFFGERAADYRASKSHGNAAELERMLALVGDVRGSLCLDVATGGGHTARALRDAGARVIAHDGTRAMLAGLEWPAVLSDAQRLPFRASTFDVIASRIAPHHFEDLAAFCREAARALRPGGALYVFDLSSPDDDPEAARLIDRIERLRDPSHFWSRSPREWREALEAGGLAVERLDATVSAFDLEPWIARARMAPEAERELRALVADPRVRKHGYGLAEDGRMRVLRVEILARTAGQRGRGATGRNTRRAD